MIHLACQISFLICNDCEDNGIIVTFITFTTIVVPSHRSVVQNKSTRSNQAIPGGFTVQQSLYENHRSLDKLVKRNCHDDDNDDVLPNDAEAYVQSVEFWDEMEICGAGGCVILNDRLCSGWDSLKNCTCYWLFNLLVPKFWHLNFSTPCV
jgi:hypothetical protein